MRWPEGVLDGQSNEQITVVERFQTETDDGRQEWCVHGNLTNEWWNEQKGQEGSEWVRWMRAVVLRIAVKALIWKSQLRLAPLSPRGRAALHSLTLGMREMISGYLVVLSSWLRLNIRTSPLSRMWICKAKIKRDKVWGQKQISSIYLTWKICISCKILLLDLADVLTASKRRQLL